MCLRGTSAIQLCDADVFIVVDVEKRRDVHLHRQRRQRRWRRLEVSRAGATGHVRSSARDRRRILHLRQRKSGLLRGRAALHRFVEGKVLLLLRIIFNMSWLGMGLRQL